MLGIVPFLGPIIYMLFRPPEYLEDVRERDLEIRAMEKRLGGRDLHCPVCRAEVEEDFLVCPVCTTAAPAGLHDVPPAARGALAGLPVLRHPGPGRRRHRRHAGSDRSDARRRSNARDASPKQEARCASSHLRLVRQTRRSSPGSGCP